MEKILQILKYIWRNFEKIVVAFLAIVTIIFVVISLFMYGPKVALAVMLIGAVQCCLVLLIGFMNRVKEKLLKKLKLSLEDSQNDS